MNRLEEIREREPMTHELKCWTGYYAEVETGAKPFEIRKWDRPFRVGDTLLLKEYDPATDDCTGKELRRKITYLLDMTYLPGDNIPRFAGYVALGLESPEVERLTAERDAEKRRAEAAEKDLQTMADSQACAVCAFREESTCKERLDKIHPGGHSHADESCFQWRGPCAQNAEGGPADDA